MSVTPSQLIDQHISQFADWRGQLMTRLRAVIHEASPELTEEWKWDTPVFSYNGMVCALGAFSDHVKINFFKGAALPDPTNLFNSGLEAKKTRAIDFHEGDEVRVDDLKTLVRSAVALNNVKKATMR